MYSVRLSKPAAKDLDSLPDSIGKRVYAALQTLVATPRPVGCKRLSGIDDTYRIRVGDFRILYDVDDGARLVVILRVQHRKDAYRDL